MTGTNSCCPTTRPNSSTVDRKAGGQRRHRDAAAPTLSTTPTPHRHGDGADKLTSHALAIVTAEGANHALHRRPHRRLTLAHAEGHRLYALWVLLVMLGLRRGEALAVRWADVDLNAGTVAILGSLQRVGNQLQRVPTKTRGSLRTIPLPAPCLEALRAHRARQNSDRLAAGARWVAMELVFSTRHGTPVEPRTVNRMFGTMTDAASLRPVQLHDLRHGCVSLLLSLGVPPRTVMQIVGHTVMEMTMERYGHVNLADQQEALSLLDQALR